MNSVNININDLKLKTGDLLVCDDLQHDDWGLFSWFIKFFTKSDYSHVGMIVVDDESRVKGRIRVDVWHIRRSGC
jgi:hypothetical protein